MANSAPGEKCAEEKMISMLNDQQQLPSSRVLND
jgi:hypothetical protein